MSGDLTAELGRSQNAYVFRAADGHNSIAVRTSDEELAECYRLMAEARDEITRLREEIDEHQRRSRLDGELEPSGQRVPE